MKRTLLVLGFYTNISIIKNKTKLDTQVHPHDTQQYKVTDHFLLY